MEASKNTLRKMPTDRLIEYLKEDNRYVSRAVEYAFEILQQERGIYFSDEEILRIQNFRFRQILHRHFAFHLYSVAADTPCRRHRSVTCAPASCSFRTLMI